MARGTAPHDIRMNSGWRPSYISLSSHPPSKHHPMQNTVKKIKIIRDKLSRIGIGEKNLDDATILASYGINQKGNLCSVAKIQ